MRRQSVLVLTCQGHQVHRKEMSRLCDSHIGLELISAVDVMQDT